jgi:hypothetical protein
MFSLRNIVVALVVTAATVLVLVAVTAGVFAAPPADPLVPQANPVDQHARTQQPNVVPQPVPAQQTVIAQQPVIAGQPDAVTQPDVGQPQPVTHVAPAVRQQLVTRSAIVRTPVAPAAKPVAQDPVPVAGPAPDRQQAARPPAPVASPPAQKSRTVNTEPCACNGTMRKVPTHWDPPHN